MTEWYRNNPSSLNCCEWEPEMVPAVKTPYYGFSILLGRIEDAMPIARDGRE